jgi:hypothetical protein
MIIARRTFAFRFVESVDCVLIASLPRLQWRGKLFYILFDRTSVT